MKLIILAAGRGERLMPLTRNTPKPLIDMGNGNTLLEQQIDNIRESGAINEIVLVVGYLAEQIEAKMKSYQEKFSIRTIYNPFWNVSNNLFSLWLARHVIAEDDVMITNGDNIFNPSVFAGLVTQSEGIWISACKKNKFDSDDMKIKLTDGHVSQVSKKIPENEASLESPGLVLVKGQRARQLFVEQLEGVVRADENKDRFWLEIFNHMWKKGLPIKPWIFESQGNWQEIDFHLDVSQVRNMLAEKVNCLHQEVIS